MKRGHVTGTKRERRGSQDWYAAIAAETLRQLDTTTVAASSQSPPVVEVVTATTGPTTERTTP